MTQQQIAKFNSLYQKACEKMKGLIILDGYRPTGIRFFEKIRANKAIKYFNDALSIYPNHFQSLFFLGKLYQRLCKYDQALLYFEATLKLEDTNHLTFLEASLTAMHLDQVEKAITYSGEGIRRKPNDFALLGNHAMNLLIAGLDNDAKETIARAITLNPKDEINLKIKDKIERVINGQVRRPTFKESLG